MPQVSIPLHLSISKPKPDNEYKKDYVHKSFQLELHFTSIKDPKEKKKAVPLVDTGSGPLVIGSEYLHVGYYTEDAAHFKDFPVPGYSSSGNTYQGAWVWVDGIQVSGVDAAPEPGTSVTLKRIAVFRSTSPSGVCMMGIGIRQSGASDDAADPITKKPGEGFSKYYREFSAFFNIKTPDMPVGYMIARAGANYSIKFGLTADDLKGFTQFSFEDDAFINPKASFTLKSKDNPIEVKNVPLLMDTGICEIICTPIEPNTSIKHGNFDLLQAGEEIQVTITNAENKTVTWTVNSLNASGDDNFPPYYRIARPSHYGIINTGVHFLLGFADYALLPANPVPHTGAIKGYIGLKPR